MLQALHRNVPTTILGLLRPVISRAHSRFFSKTEASFHSIGVTRGHV